MACVVFRARKNSAVLHDSHWVGGDPVLEQVYGFAAWSADPVGMGILTLRNPSLRPAMFRFSLASVWELLPSLPGVKSASYKISCRYQRRSSGDLMTPDVCEPHWLQPCEEGNCKIDISTPVTLVLAAMDVLVLEGHAVAS